MPQAINNAKPCFDTTSDIHKTFKWYGNAMRDFWDRYVPWYVIDRYLLLYKLEIRASVPHSPVYDDEQLANLVVLDEYSYDKLRKEHNVLICNKRYEDDGAKMCLIDFRLDRSIEEALSYNGHTSCIVLCSGSPQTRLLWAHWDKVQNDRILLQTQLDLPIGEEHKEEQDTTTAVDEVAKALGYNKELERRTTRYKTNGRLVIDGNYRVLLDRLIRTAPDKAAQRLREYRDQERKCMISHEYLSSDSDWCVAACCSNVFKKEPFESWLQDSNTCPSCRASDPGYCLLSGSEHLSHRSTLLEVLRKIDTTDKCLVLDDSNSAEVSLWQSVVDLYTDTEDLEIGDYKTIVIALDEDDERENEVKRAMRDARSCEALYIIE
jgi:hypothetical protein